jgi:hypothetical protein
VKCSVARWPPLAKRSVPVKRARACICTMSGKVTSVTAPVKPLRWARALSSAPSRASGEYGFSRYSTEARLRTSSRTSGEPKAVTTTAGRLGATARARMSSSRPFMTGMRTSTTMASGGLASTRRRASRGSVKPSTARSGRRASRRRTVDHTRFSSSSTR